MQTWLYARGKTYGLLLLLGLVLTACLGIGCRLLGFAVSLSLCDFAWNGLGTTTSKASLEPLFGPILLLLLERLCAFDDGGARLFADGEFSPVQSIDSLLGSIVCFDCDEAVSSRAETGWGLVKATLYDLVRESGWFVVCEFNKER